MESRKVVVQNESGGGIWQKKKTLRLSALAAKKYGYEVAKY